MKRLLVTAALIATLSGPAFATADGCASVIGTSDGYLSVRTGPGKTHPEIFSLPRGRTIWIDSKPDGASNKWWHVTGVVTSDGQVTQVDGWAYGRYLSPINCTATHAGSKPTLPEVFHGQWCYAQATNDYFRASPCNVLPYSRLDIKSDGFVGQDGTDGPQIRCTVRQIEAYGHDTSAYRATFKCRGAIEGTQQYWIGRDGTRLFMFENTDKPL